MQVVLLTDKPDGNDGLAMQFVMRPVVVGACITAISMLSSTELGEKDRAGLGMSTLRFSVAVADPVLFDAVMI